MVSRYDVVTRGGEGYPARLGQVSDAPEVLYVKGQLQLGALSVAIVGARAASGWARDLAQSLAAEVVRAGGVVVSGGALGVDGAAHRGALGAGGKTVVVQACGLDHVYPARHRSLFRTAAKRGAVISPYPDTVGPRRWQFVRRNRVIAALADAVVLVDAGIASGSLYTAAAARNYGRLLCAVPGSKGCDALIAHGAAVIADAGDLFAALAGRPRQVDVSLPIATSEHGKILSVLTTAAPHGHDSLAALTGLPSRTVARTLLELEVEGLAVGLPGREFVRTALAQSLLDGEAG